MNGVDKNKVMRPHHTYSLARISYEGFNNDSNEIFGHYFRNLYTILKTIDELPENFNRKKYYSRIVRSQLSMSELTVLFLNCLFKVCDDGKFAGLLIKYQMLEHLKLTSISNPKSAMDIEPQYLDYKIGDMATVSIYEMAYYMYGEKKFSIKNFASEEITHGAFGKNTARCLNQIQEMVLFRPANMIAVYGEPRRKQNILNRLKLKFKWVIYKWKMYKVYREKPF